MIETSPPDVGGEQRGAPRARRFSALLSSDVVAYTRLMANDEEATLDALKAYRLEARALAHQHAGRIVDCPGDNLLAEFPSANDALACAISLQRTIRAQGNELVPARRLHVRIGVHVADVIVDDDLLYGDGVNIAARLEGAADPGGILLSSTAAEQVTLRDVVLETAGERRLKNVAKPLQTFRVAGLGEPSRPREWSVPGFGGRPAIAVLPFAALDGDAAIAGESFAYGVTEDLVTRLSGWRSFPIIACAPAAGRPADLDLRQTARNLGVGYLVSGSVRRTEKRVRLIVKLLEAETDHVLWAQTYDREIDDLLRVQDSISTEIVGALEPELRRIEPRRVRRRDPSELDAWECVQRGQWHTSQVSREGNQIAQQLFRRAIELDPDFASAYGYLGISITFDALFRWRPDRAAALFEAVRIAEKGLALDDADPFVHRALGGIYVFLGRLDDSIAENLRAIELNPSYALGYWGAGQQLSLSGRPDEGLAMLRTARRLSPNDPLIDQFLADFALTFFCARSYAQAAVHAEQSVRLRGSGNWAWPFLVASHVRMKDLDEARRARERMIAAAGFDLDLRMLEVTLRQMCADAALIQDLIGALEQVEPV